MSNFEQLEAELTAAQEESESTLDSFLANELRATDVVREVAHRRFWLEADIARDALLAEVTGSPRTLSPAELAAVTTFFQRVLANIQRRTEGDARVWVQSSQVVTGEFRRWLLDNRRRQEVQTRHYELDPRDWGLDKGDLALGAEQAPQPQVIPASGAERYKAQQLAMQERQAAIERYEAAQAAKAQSAAEAVSNIAELVAATADEDS